MLFVSIELEDAAMTESSCLKQLQILDDKSMDVQICSGAKLPDFNGETIIVYDAVMALSALKRIGAKAENFEDVKLMAKLSDGFQMDHRLFTPVGRHHYPYSIRHGHNGGCEVNVYRLRHLYRQLQVHMEERHYEREKAAVPAIVDMQLAGIAFDYDGWHRSLAPKWQELEDAQERLKENPSCPESQMKRQRLSQYLHAYDTAAKRSVYQDRLYCQWDSFASQSGRMAARKPNLQAMPKSSRPYFRARQGKLLVFADYSQIELRVLAEITRDSGLMNIFQQQGDVHTQTAAKLFRKSAEAISEQERSIAKTLNFGTIYGITAYGVQKNLQKQKMPCSLEQADQFRHDFLDLHPGVQRFQQMMACAKKVRSLGGRFFDVSDCRETQKMNLPVQATSAEGLKLALAIVHGRLKQDWHLVAAVHDELILEVPSEDAEVAKETLVAAMEQGMRQLLKTVPVVVEASVSPIWSTDAKEINTYIKKERNS